MRLFEYINQGGAIMYLLLALNIVGWALALYKFYTFRTAGKSADQVADSLSHELDQIKGLNRKDSEAMMAVSKQEVSYYMAEHEKGLNTIKIIAAISPLLGLLGTVVGVLVSFKVISASGMSNPAAFAEGISMALITTVGGLIVAIPHYIAHNYLVAQLDRLEVVLEKKLVTRVLANN